MGEDFVSALQPQRAGNTGQLANWIYVLGARDCRFHRDYR